MWWWWFAATHSITRGIGGGVEPASYLHCPALAPCLVFVWRAKYNTEHSADMCRRHDASAGADAISEEESARRHPTPQNPGQERNKITRSINGNRGRYRPLNLCHPNSALGLIKKLLHLAAGPNTNRQLKLRSEVWIDVVARWAMYGLCNCNAAVLVQHGCDLGPRHDFDAGIRGIFSRAIGDFCSGTHCTAEKNK